MSYKLPKAALINAEKNAARKEITKSIRDLLSLKMTVPIMGRPFKGVHTNQFLWTTLPKDFALANFGEISKFMTSSDNRFSQYQTNRWYIEGLTITNDGDKFEMEFELNPFPTSQQEFIDNLKSYEKAYRDEQEKANKNNNSNNTAQRTVPSVKTDNDTIKQFTSRWVYEKCKAICGSQRDPMKKAQLIDKAFKSHIYYKFYYDLKFNNNEKRWNNAHLNCADGANLLSALLNTAMIDAVILNTPGKGEGHYIVRMKINGKYYYTDCSAGDGQLCNKPFNTVYGPKSGSVVGRQI